MLIAIVLITTLLILTAFYAVEDRDQMLRIDVSPARPDTGDWLTR